MSTLQHLASSLLTIGFEGTTDVPAEAAELISCGVSGAILFRRNVESPRQVASLCAALKRTAGRSFLLCVDQEGGRVARLRGAPFTALPPMRTVGTCGNPKLAFEVGRLLGREVRAGGFDVDFAPVLDVDTNPANPVIGDRALSREAEEVSRLGIALAQGLESEGVASCGKHFPGHGDTSQDSHLTLPRLPHAMGRLREIELAPFRAYAQAGLGAIMTAHVVFEALEPDVPATFSRKAQTELLRGEVGFDGVVISDDLEMKAIADRYSMEEAAVQAVAAGVDLLLVCHRADRQHACIEGLVKEAEKSPAFRKRVFEASGRVERWKRRFAAPPAGPEALSLLDGGEHRALVQRVLAATGGLTSSLRDPTERHG